MDICVAMLMLTQFFLLVCSSRSNAAVLVEQRIWLMDISAHGRYNSSAWSGNIDLEKDLGIGNAGASQTRVILELNPSSLIRMDMAAGTFTGSADWTERRWFMDGLISREFHHHVVEQIDTRLWKLGWINNLKPLKGTKSRIGLLVDLKGYSADGLARVSSAMGDNLPTTFARKMHWQTVSPMLGIVLASKPNAKTDYFIEMSGFAQKGNFSYIDCDATVRFFLDSKKNTGLTLGYRFSQYNNNKQKDRSDFDRVRLSGFNFGISKKF